MNIHLHNTKRGKSILKEDLDKEIDLEYRKSLPYDAMGDFSSIMKSADGSPQLHPHIHKIVADIEGLLDVEDNTLSWSCVAEKNYYWTFGG